MKQHYVKFQRCWEVAVQKKKVIPPTGDQMGKDTQASQPKMGRFVEGKWAYKIKFHNREWRPLKIRHSSDHITNEITSQLPNNDTETNLIWAFKLTKRGQKPLRSSIPWAQTEIYKPLQELGINLGSSQQFYNP